MTNLLDLTVAAHGGLDHFNQLKTLSVHQRLGGKLWALKGQEGALDNTRLTVDLHREHVSYVPFKLPNQRTDFTPERVAVETNEGEVVEERHYNRTFEKKSKHPRSQPVEGLSS